MIIAVANQKGGVGKTTTATALASGLAFKGYKTLLVDNDPQCNATDTYRAITDGQATVYDLMKKDGDITEAIQKTKAGDIIACDPLLKKADNEFMDIGRNYLLREAIEPIKSLYDYIIIDTSPGLGVLMLNALTAADSIILPIMTGRYSLQGLSQLRESILDCQKYTNPNLTVMGVLITQSQEHTNIMKELLGSFAEIESAFNTKLFKTSIRSTVRVKEAESSRQTIFEHAPHCTAAIDYMKIIEDVIKRSKNNG